MRKMRKSYQRKFNKLIRKANKNIADDPLWLGRFEVRQKDAWFEKFYDNSGGILHVVLRLYDKKTSYFCDYKMEYAPYYHSNDWHLFEIINKFIVDKVKVWEENPSPRDKNFIKDYRNISIPQSIMNEWIKLW